MEGMRSMGQRVRIGLAVTVAIAAIAVAAGVAAPAPQALAGELSGGAIVEYEPQSWPFAVSVGGRGQLELVEVQTRVSSAAAALRAAPLSPEPGPVTMRSSAQAAAGFVVRDGTAELEVSRGQVLVFRIVPDEGASLVSVRIGGEDASDILGADGVLVLPAEQAQVSLDVAFSATAAEAGGGAQDALGRLLRTGDASQAGVIALVGAAVAALFALRRTHARRASASDAACAAVPAGQLPAAVPPARAAAAMLHHPCGSAVPDAREDDGR